MAWRQRPTIEEEHGTSRRLMRGGGHDELLAVCRAGGGAARGRSQGDAIDEALRAPEHEPGGGGDSEHVLGMGPMVGRPRRRKQRVARSLSEGDDGEAQCRRWQGEEATRR